MTYDDLLRATSAVHLDITGAFHPAAEDAAPDGTQTLILLSPMPGMFWPALTASPEHKDGAPDPVDRWSLRVISALASELGGTALFPFGGPPFHPFIRWAHRSGRTWASPANLLVNDTQGMMISFRGAVALPERVELPSPPSQSPCATCADKPCLTTCPVDALTSKGYDVVSCKDHARTDAGAACQSGCLVRRACPVSGGAKRQVEQSAHHMRYFL